MCFVGWLLIGNGAFAADNNGPDTQCPAGAISGKLNNASYNSLLTSFNNSSYQSMVSTPSNTIPLQIKMSKEELPNSNSNTTNSFAVNSNNSDYALNINKRFANNTTAATNITLEFRNSNTLQPLYLNKVALSAFDIDASITGSNNFDDYVKFTGVTASGPIDGKIQTISGSDVEAFNGGSRTSAVDNTGCSSKNLQTRCQGSVVFEEPVKSITLTYKTTSRIKSSATTNQEIDFLIDSYCYQPLSYEINKDDDQTIVPTNTQTNYTIKVTNTGGSALQNIVLKDPAASGLSKQSGISCDATDTTNTCSTPPTVTQLERTAGFTIPSLAVGKSYSIKVPTLVTAATGSSVTNTASIKTSNLDLKTASDTNTVTSIFGGGSTSDPATCPSGHKMYYFGASPPAYTPKETASLGWTSNVNNTNPFSINGINLTLAFSDISYLRTGYPNYSSFSGVTNNAINMYHDSPFATVNHRLTATIDRPVSKFGFLVQDLDTSEDRYVESMSLDNSNGNATGGVFSFPSSFSNLLELSNSNQTISGARWNNCSTGSPCDFNVDWGYQSAGTPFVVTHGNTFNTTSSPGQLMGYSDFYFCLAPPKLIVKKALTDTRINDTNAKRDQFEIKVTGGSLAANSFTTTGNGSSISNGSSAVLSLAEGTSYTITEQVKNGTAVGDIANYSATYTCTNATTNSTTVMPTTAMTYDATAKTRSFTLEGVTYGDEITCTITNTPAQYSFTGFVFNDNGGVANTDPQNVSSFINVNDYFNGSFEPSIESGIFDTNLKVRLTDCGANDGTNIASTSAQSVSDVAATRGQYTFTVPASALANRSNVCLVQVEPNPWNDYTVDTTSNKYEIMLKSGVFDYRTGVQDAANNTLNLDFGEVTQNQSALVLKKHQYVHDCDASLNYREANLNSADIAKPADGFSINTASKVEPGKCIAYKIEAYNRGHIALTDIKITDNLQERTATQPESTFALPIAKFIINNNETSITNQNRKIVSTLFDLPNTSTTTAPVILYFNTKYGTSNSANP